MSIQAKNPEEIMPESVDFVVKNGVRLRKGSVLSLLNNAQVLESNASIQEKEVALRHVKSLADGVVASGMHKHVTWNNPEIQRIFDEAATNFNG